MTETRRYEIATPMGGSRARIMISTTARLKGGIMRTVVTGVCGLAIATTSTAAQGTASDKPVPVTGNNFIRAETDVYFGKYVKQGAFGKLVHSRQPTSIDKQDVVRMNRDTIYSSGVFDLEASPVTITLPDTGKRLMSMQVVSEDHFTTEVVYTPGRYTYTKDKVGTRYVFMLIRTLAHPQVPSDMKTANGFQDAIQVEQASVGRFEVLISRKALPPNAPGNSASILLSMCQSRAPPGTLPRFGLSRYPPSDSRLRRRACDESPR